MSEQLAQLDPRGKLAAQTALAAGAFAHTTPHGLALLTGVVGVGVWLASLSLRRLLWPYRWLVPFLLAGPVVTALRVGPPWIEPTAAVEPALASYRTAVLVVLGGLYVQTTPVRDSEAAIAWLVPGRVGRLLAVTVGLVFRFLPAIRQEAQTTKRAMDVRLGGQRPLWVQIRLFTERLLVRLFRRADRLALALRARNLSWNPTYPALSVGWRDVPLGCLTVAAVWWTLAG